MKPRKQKRLEAIERATRYKWENSRAKRLETATREQWEARQRR